MSEETMTTVLKAPTLRLGRSKATGRKNWGYTALAIFFTAIMLFPVYWMLNASLQPNGTTLETSWLPLKPDFTGYATAISEQAGNLGTSLIISPGSVALSPQSQPRRPTRWPTSRSAAQALSSSPS